MKALNGDNDRQSTSGFRLFRSQRSLELTPHEIHLFNTGFEGHGLYQPRRSAVSLVARYESRQAIANSRRLRSVPLPVLVRNVMERGPASSKYALELLPGRLHYVRSYTPGQLRITLDLDDPNGDLEAEREAYNKALGRLGGVSLPSTVFAPDLNLGVLRGPEYADGEALANLAERIPDTIRLARVYAYPNPFVVKH